MMPPLHRELPRHRNDATLSCTMSKAAESLERRPPCSGGSIDDHSVMGRKRRPSRLAERENDTQLLVDGTLPLRLGQIRDPPELGPCPVVEQYIHAAVVIECESDQCIATTWIGEIARVQ